ncbi:MAG: replicative DNA helicase [Prevotellaceae bacterium]|jgi:replicative DNA helicase|nr:replicative DNA helicase [Prevotellaceae bacterium]
MAKTNTPTYKKNAANVQLAGLELGKKPPQALDLEEAILGAVMLEKEAIFNVQGLLKPESFYKEAHQKIYRAALELSSNHDPIDIYTVSEELKKKGVLDEVGGYYFLSQLTLKVGSAAHVEYHAKIVAQKYIQRELIRISSEAQRDAFDDAIGVDELLDGVQQKIFDIVEGNMRSETQHIRPLVEEVTKEIETIEQNHEGLSGLPSGFNDLDHITLGWHPSDLSIIAARPSMGKTAFVLTMARNMAVIHNIPVAFFSLEMSSNQLVKRLLVSETGIASTKVRGGVKMSPEDWDNLNEKITGLINAPLYIDDTPALSIFEFRTKARRLVSAHGIKIIFIDYLQLMAGPPSTQGFREQEVSAISRSLKAIAKELNIPIIALSQLNRMVETRGGSNRRPQLSDLRESGAIEQDADLVLFIHRPEYYKIDAYDDGTSTEGLADIIIAKHRNGAIDDIRLRFKSSQAKFTNLNDADEEQVQPPPAPNTYQSKMNNGYRSHVEASKDFEVKEIEEDKPF